MQSAVRLAQPGRLQASACFPCTAGGSRVPSCSTTQRSPPTSDRRFDPLCLSARAASQRQEPVESRPSALRLHSSLHSASAWIRHVSRSSQPGASALCPSTLLPVRRRRTAAPRAADDGSDVPAFKGFPPMQEKPAWYWRIFAVIPYLLPLCEGWIYNETALSIYQPLYTYKMLCQPFLMLLAYLPSWGLLAYFFIAYLGIVRNNRWPHFLRFHVVTGMLMEIILQVVGTLNDWIPASIYWGRFGSHFWLAVSLAYVFIVLECIFSAIKGMYADVPFISDAAYMQIPYE